MIPLNKLKELERRYNVAGKPEDTKSELLDFKRFDSPTSANAIGHDEVCVLVVQHTSRPIEQMGGKRQRMVRASVFEGEDMKSSCFVGETEWLDG